jgi:hypothetical protein
MHQTSQDNFPQTEPESLGIFRVHGSLESGKLESVESSGDTALKYLARVLVAEHLNQKRHERNK